MLLPGIAAWEHPLQWEDCTKIPLDKSNKKQRKRRGQHIHSVAQCFWQPTHSPWQPDWPSRSCKPLCPAAGAPLDWPEASFLPLAESQTRTGGPLCKRKPSPHSKMSYATRFCSRRVCGCPCCSLLTRKTAKPPDPQAASTLARSSSFLRSSQCFCFVCGFDFFVSLFFPVLPTSCLSFIYMHTLTTWHLRVPNKQTQHRSFLFSPSETVDIVRFLALPNFSTAFIRTYSKSTTLWLFTTSALLYAHFTSCIHSSAGYLTTVGKIDSLLAQDSSSMRFGVANFDFQL